LQTKNRTSNQLKTGEKKEDENRQNPCKGSMKQQVKVPLLDVLNNNDIHKSN